MWNMPVNEKLLTKMFLEWGKILGESLWKKEWEELCECK